MFTKKNEEYVTQWLEVGTWSWISKWSPAPQCNNYVVGLWLCRSRRIDRYRRLDRFQGLRTAAGHFNKTSQFWATQECFTFTAASAGAFCIHSRWVSKSSAEPSIRSIRIDGSGQVLSGIVTIAHHINALKQWTWKITSRSVIAINKTCRSTLTSPSRLESYKRLVSASSGLVKPTSRLGLVWAGEANVSVSVFYVSCQSLVLFIADL